MNGPKKIEVTIGLQKGFFVLQSEREVHRKRLWGFGQNESAISRSNGRYGIRSLHAISRRVIRLRHSSEAEAAIDHHRRAGREAGLVARKIHGHRRDLFGRAEAPHRLALDERLASFDGIVKGVDP